MSLPTFVRSGASFSRDARHRYRLWRTWKWGAGTCVFCMLNPSTADADVLDPTVAKCVRLADAWGYGRLEVVNLFAFRGTNPDDLLPLRMDDRLGGEMNDKAIVAAALGAQFVVAAWGAHKAIGDRGHDVLRMLAARGVTVHALRLGKGGAPYHPLYQPENLKPRRIQLRGTIIQLADEAAA